VSSLVITGSGYPRGSGVLKSRLSQTTRVRKSWPRGDCTASLLVSVNGTACGTLWARNSASKDRWDDRAGGRPASVPRVRQVPQALARPLHMRGSRMSLRVLCCFSHLTGPDGWQDPHHSVNQFVNAVKGRRLTGYAYVRLFPHAPRRRLDAMNAHEAIDWFG